MRKLAIGAATSVAVLLGAAGAAEARVPDQDRARVREARPQVHVVREGETLAGLAPDVWREVAADNDILLTADTIHPGQRINMRVLRDPAARWFAAVEVGAVEHWFANAAPPPPPPAPEPVEIETEAIVSTPEELHAPEPEVVEEVSAPAPAPAVSSGSVWDQLAQCESGGNWAINTGNGYYGGLQFSASSWAAVGGSGLPHEHSRETQIAMGERLKASQGWGAWPACSAQLGLR